MQKQENFFFRGSDQKQEPALKQKKLMKDVVFPPDYHHHVESLITTGKELCAHVTRMAGESSASCGGNIGSVPIRQADLKVMINLIHTYQEEMSALGLTRCIGTVPPPIPVAKNAIVKDESDDEDSDKASDDD